MVFYLFFFLLEVWFDGLDQTIYSWFMDVKACI